MVRWPSGQAQVCKTCHSGSIPLRTSKNASENISGAFAISDFPTIFLQIDSFLQKKPQRISYTEAVTTFETVALSPTASLQRYSNFSINQSLTIFVIGTGELNIQPTNQLTDENSY